mmetsp:Transcript_65640/g.181973  ORF Transcript_65640/g.181973 Transcript_65640/m.181973 type:complete len:186 (+) Transcript_65640:106-663(+)
MLAAFLGVLGPLIARFGNVRVLQISLAVCVVMPLACSRCTLKWHLWLVAAVFAGPVVLAIPVVAAIKSNLVAKDEQGLVQGAIASISKGSVAVGYIMFGLICKKVTHGGRDASHSAAFPAFLAIAAISLLSLLLACSLAETPPPPPPETEHADKIVELQGLRSPSFSSSRSSSLSSLDESWWCYD